jgi:DNA-binding NarL/FixJ family response regulator
VVVEKTHYGKWWNSILKLIGTTVSIYVIDDHPLMKEAICSTLRRTQPGKNVVGVESMEELMEAIATHGQPTVFSLDLLLPDAIGVSGIVRLKKLYPLVPLAVLSASLLSENEAKCLEAGANVYIEKGAGAGQIRSAFNRLMQISEEALKEPTKRQLQLMVLVEQGCSNKDIAEKLNINEHTVKVHMWRLFRKLDVSSRTQALNYAHEAGWFTA